MPGLANERLDGLVHAPEFPSHLEWLNTDKPLSLAAFRGKIVLLDFWTFCCINCMHVIPDLKKLEAKYSKELVVIGVHSAKFQNEKQSESIRQAILRYGIKHPVINDLNMEVWQQYGIRSWPTLVLINPRGRVIGVKSGEGIFDLFDSIIAQTIPYFDQKKELKRGPLVLALEEAKQAKTLLSFPGKIHADAQSNRLFITDSNHNRIIVVDLEGNILDSIGSGQAGKKDGSFEDADFDHPQGTFAEGGFLYIADTENHLVRRADLKSRQVTTLLGTGQQARGSGAGTQAPLNSPWDLLVHEGNLYIAMAGSHQIYAADLKTLEAKPHAGSGGEARLDGPLISAALAQPSGLATDGKKIYFADSEVSSIRSADIHPSGKVETIVGEDLFEFGDIDGPSRTARLQHPLGVAFSKGILYVADTYNSKIKKVDPGKLTSHTYAGTGKHGLKDGPFKEAQFFEPGGLAVLGDNIYVADTNNHEIRVLDTIKNEVRTFEFKGLEKLARQTMKHFKGREVAIPKQTVKEGEVLFRMDIKLPAGYKLNSNAPLHADWKSEEDGIVSFSKETPSGKSSFPLEIRAQAASGKTNLLFEAVIYYCTENSSVCLFDHVRMRMPVEVSKSGASVLPLDVVVEAT